MKTSIDFHRIPENQQAMHARLLNWANYVRVRKGHVCAPMWRYMRSNARMWHTPEAVRVMDAQDGAAMEKAIAALPRIYAKALRWFYVHQGPPARIARELSVSYEALARIVGDARSILMLDVNDRFPNHSYTALHAQDLTD